MSEPGIQFHQLQHRVLFPEPLSAEAQGVDGSDSEQVRSLRQRHGRHAVIVVQPLRRNLGHPYPLVLARHVEEAGPQASIVVCARTYRRPPCLSRFLPARAPLSTVVYNTTFNDALAAADCTEDNPRTREQLLQGVFCIVWLVYGIAFLFLFHLFVYLFLVIHFLLFLLLFSTIFP